jgi:hypothetical protein
LWAGIWHFSSWRLAVNLSAFLSMFHQKPLHVPNVVPGTENGEWEVHRQPLPVASSPFPFRFFWTSGSNILRTWRKWIDIVLWNFGSWNRATQP